MSRQDKDDMLAGLISDQQLETAVKCWMHSGMPDYANGDTRPYKADKGLPMARYRGNGV